MAKDAEPIELRPRALQDGSVDVASVRWTLEHMHNELAGNAEMARVRNALAIALLEVDRIQQNSAALGDHGAAWSRYLPWPKR
jgi:hypothetical protein